MAFPILYKFTHRDSFVRFDLMVACRDVHVSKVGGGEDVIGMASVSMVGCLILDLGGI